MDTLYREEILEHYRDPQHFGVLRQFDVTSHQHNPFCGDDITLYLSLKKDFIVDISFEGRGCAISIAAGSMLMEYALGKSMEALRSFSDTEMIALLGVSISETRKKCALLAVATLRDCL